MAEEVDFLATARKRFSAAAEEEKHLRDAFTSDLKFASPDGADQWDPLVKMQREASGRPAMAFPRCHTFVQQVSNEARQNKAQIKYAPRLDADKDTADVYEGLARYIQYSSDAQVAYETAVEYSAGGSFGFWRFLTDYCDDESDDLELKIVPVLDPLTVYGILIPTCFNRVVKYAFVIEDVPKEEYKAQYGDSEMASLSWEESGQRDGWVDQDSVRIAEYWYVEDGPKRANGRKGKPIVKFCKTNGMEVLKDTETTWPGATIPIVPVLGSQMIIEGKPRLFSVVRPQKAAQQLINYTKSRIAETLSTAPISPFLMVEGQIEGYEEQWASLNSVLRPTLTYKAVDVAGRPAPTPQRQVYEPPIQSLSSFVMQEVEDMKATTGIYDAALGSSGTNETSGQMVKARQQQSNLTTMHFMDNLARSFKQGGKIMEEVIPEIYDTARQITIVGSDEKEKVVMINKPHTDDNGKSKHFKLAGIKMGLIVTMGRSFDSKRMESFDMMQQVIQSSPQSFPIMADIFFRNSDMAGADQLAERFKRALPPNLQDQDGEEPVSPQAQAQMQQLNEHNQALNAACQHLEQHVQQLTFEQKARTVEQQGKMQMAQVQHQFDMELEDKKLLTQITVAEIGTKAQIVSDRESDRAALEAQFHDQAHDVAMSAHQHGQAQELQSQQADTQSQQSAQDAQQQQEAQAQSVQNQPADPAQG